MDLLFAILVILVYFIYRKTHPIEVPIGSMIVQTEDGTTEEVDVFSMDSLKVGTNLMLRREPRAYHKILDELGLGKV